jgi:hypothetical protein
MAGVQAGAPPFDITEVATTPLRGAPSNLQAPLTDGERLYARQSVHGITARLLRLDARTGAVVASYAFRAPPPGTPYVAGSFAMAITNAGIVTLDGDRSVAHILNPDTLAVRRVVPLPAGSRTDMPPDIDLPTGAFWVGHQLWTTDSIVGKNTLMGATRVLPLASAPQTIPVPPCGTKGGVQPTPRLLVIDLECAYQIAIVDLQTHAVFTFPSLLSRVDVNLLGGQVWARWKNLGIVERIDAVHRTRVALDLNVDGPVLSTLNGMRYAEGHLWLTGTPADASLPQVLYEIDPRTVTVVARAWLPIVAMIHGVGYVVDANGRLATFATAAISGGAPAQVARPSIHAPVLHAARNATEQAVMRDFSLVYNYKIPNAVVAQFLEQKPTVVALRTKLTTLAHTLFANVRVIVTDVAVQGQAASVSYSFLLGKTAAFVPLSAQLNLVGKRWVVTGESICHLADVAGVGNC